MQALPLTQYNYFDHMFHSNGAIFGAIQGFEIAQNVFNCNGLQSNSTLYWNQWWSLFHVEYNRSSYSRLHRHGGEFAWFNINPLVAGVDGVRVRLISFLMEKGTWKGTVWHVMEGEFPGWVPVTGAPDRGTLCHLYQFWQIYCICPLIGFLTFPCLFHLTVCLLW